MSHKRPRSPSLIIADLRERPDSPLLRAELAALQAPSPAVGIPVEIATIPLVVGVAKQTRVDLGAGEGIGEFVRRNEYGTWRTVPGFDPAHLIVSSEGWTRTRTSSGKELCKPHIGCQKQTGYYCTRINGHPYFVHCLILRAFEGPRLSTEHTGDHKNRNRSDNRACNLCWETPEGQCANRGKRKALRTGQPVRVRRADWPTEYEWVTYPSAKAADTACGVKYLNNVANPNDRHKSVKDKEGFKWLAEWAEPDETPEDLPPDPDYVDAKGDPKPQDKEEWRDAIYNDGNFLKGVRVSSHGRAQCKHPRGSGWGHRFTPRPAEGEGYAEIAGGKKFHIAVFCSFGGTLVGDDTVDHIDRDKTNNMISNLDAASKSRQALNQTRKPIKERNNSHKQRIGCRHRDWPTTTPGLEFASLSDSARALGGCVSAISANLSKKRYPEGHKQVGQLMSPAVHGYVFYKIATSELWEENWGPE